MSKHYKNDSQYVDKLSLYSKKMNQLESILVYHPLAQLHQQDASELLLVHSSVSKHFDLTVVTAVQKLTNQPVVMEKVEGSDCCHLEGPSE